MRQGRRTEALALLEQGLAGGDPELRSQARNDPTFAPLAGDPGYEALLRPGTGDATPPR